MENSRTFTIDRISVRECMDVGNGERWTLGGRKSGMEALEYMADVLRAYGLEVEVTRSKAGGTASLSIAHPEPYEAETLRNRGGGRPKERRTYGVSLEWLESHSVEEGMEALGGVSRRTYYRRLKEMRAEVSES